MHGPLGTGETNVAIGDISFGLTMADLMAPDGGPPLSVDAQSGGVQTVPGGESLLTAAFSRAGPDLVIEATDGSQVVVHGYFEVAEPPALQTAGGARLDADLIARLAPSPAAGQVAQDGGAIGSAPIGTVDTAEGGTFAVRADGTRVALNAGDPVFTGDIIETGPDGNLSIVFLDNSAFTLGDGARMVLDELVYDPASHTGTSSFSVVQGVFTFVSGAIAKSGSDAMIVRTPVATIGIRGTEVAVQAATDGGTTTITLLEEQSGVTGEIVITNSAGSQVLNIPFQTTFVDSFFTAPTAAIVLPPAQVTRIIRRRPPHPPVGNQATRNSCSSAVPSGAARH